MEMCKNGLQAIGYKKEGGGFLLFFPEALEVDEEEIMRKMMMSMKRGKEPQNEEESEIDQNVRKLKEYLRVCFK
jgi:hypothetical protein